MDVLESFIGKYPVTFYAELARVQLKELKRKQQAALVAPPPPKALSLPPDPALEAWNAAKNSENVSVLETFIDKYPLSFFAEVAKAKIDGLKKKEQEATRLSMVLEIQKALKDIDCYGGIVDGVWNDTSRKALDRFSRLAELDPTLGEPVQATLDLLKAWKGVASWRRSRRLAVKRRNRPLASVLWLKVAKTPKAPSKVAKTPQAPARVAKSPRSSPPKEPSANKPSSMDTSVYCHQGCAGGFENVLKGTATNPGMKR